MATKRDYYEILNVERTAAQDDIRRAYRKMAMKFHPDRNPGDAATEQKFKEAAEAYEVLNDPDKRQRYNRFGHEGLRGTSGHDFSHMDAGDIFSMFEDIFGGIAGGGGRSRGRGQRGYDLETQTVITLAEVATGVERDIEFTRQDHCPTCSGSGAKPGSSPITCSTCGGHGQVAQSGFGGMFRMVTTCPSCGGGGQVIRDKCPDCKGSGRKPKKRVLQVKIPPGIQDGQAIRIPGEGEPGTGAGNRGNLHVLVRVAQHELFQREDDHLILKMPVSFTQAALGAKVKVPSLTGVEGDMTDLTIKPGTQHGELYRIRGKGLPNLHTGEVGDLIAVLMVEIPKKMSEKQRDLLRQFAATENHDVMPESKGFWSRIKSNLK